MADYESDNRGYAEDREGDRYQDRDAGRDRSRSPVRDRDGDVRVRDPSPARDTNGSRGAAATDDDPDAVNPGTNLFVTGIAPRLNEDEVQRMFEKYGGVVSCNIMRDPHTNDSRGFGFIRMDTLEAADAAKEGLQGELIEGRTLSIEKARRGKPRTSTPGRYFGPPKREDRRGGYGGGRYDDRRGGGGYRDDYRRGGGGGGGYGRSYDSYGRSGRDDRYGGGGSYGGGGYGRDDRYGGGRDRDGGRGGYESRGPPRDDYDSRGPPRGGDDRYERR